jgi:hypothetical protein
MKSKSMVKVRNGRRPNPPRPKPDPGLHICGDCGRVMRDFPEGWRCRSTKCQAKRKQRLDDLIILARGIL